MIEKDDDLIEDLKSKVESFIHNRKVVLGTQKIIITVTADDVKTKVVTPIVKEKKEAKFAPEVMQQIQKAKEILKGKHGLIYIFTLLMSLTDSLKKLDVASLPEESKELIAPALNEITLKLTTLLK